MNQRAGSPAASRRALWLLALLFFAPLLFSFWLYYGSSWRPAGRTNHGELIEPPRALPATVFRERWSLVYVGNGGCDAGCRQVLHTMRQTHASLGRLGARLQQVFLVNAGCCDHAYLAREHAELHVIDVSGPESAGLLGTFPAGQLWESVFIVDPLGNLMMRYDTRLDPRGLRQDLTKLLELSHVG